MLGSRAIGFQLDGLTAGTVSRGHKILSPGPFQIGEASGYVSDLRRRKVMVDTGERNRLIRRRLIKRAADAGYRLLPDDELLDKVVQMVEWPGVYSGEFPAEPEEQRSASVGEMAGEPG